MIGSAGAHSQTVLDPDDASGPLDVVAARAKHRVLEETVTHPGAGRTTTTLTFRLVTYESWSNEAISGHKRFVAFEFDRDRDGDADRCVVVTEEGQPELSGKIYKGCEYVTDQLTGAVSPSRPDDHSVRFSVEKRDLARRVKVLRWRVMTSYEQPGSKECAPEHPQSEGGLGSCVDTTQWKLHRL